MAKDLWPKYRVRVEAMLTAIGLDIKGPVGIIFVSPEAYERAKLGRVRVDDEDLDEAKALWNGRPDPYGFSPSASRTIACWASLV